MATASLQESQIGRVIAIMIWTVSIVQVRAQTNMVSRPNFGVVFSPIAKLQNSGSAWVNYLKLPSMTDEIIPPESRSELRAQSACSVSPSLFQNQTVVEAYQGHIETIMSICESFKPVITRYNRQKKMIITDIDDIQDHIRRLGWRNDQEMRGRRDAPLDFISTIGKGLFGFAKHSDVEEIEENLFNLRQGVNESIQNLIRNQNLMQSAMKINNDRLETAHENVRESQRRINRIVNDMRELTEFINQQVNSSLQAEVVTHNIMKFQSQLTASVMRRVISQITYLQGLRNHLQVYLAGLQTLFEGYIPITMVSPEQISEMISQIGYELMQTHPEFEVAVKDIEYYYKQKCELVSVNNEFIITLMIPLTTSASTFQLYRTHTIRVPIKTINKDRPVYTYTQIKGVSEYYAVTLDQQFYLELSEFDLSHCLGHDNYRICNPFMVQIDKGKVSCTSALFQNKPLDVKEQCKVMYFEQNQPQTDLVSIGKGSVLISTTQQDWTMVCSKMAPQTVKQCTFCTH